MFVELLARSSFSFLRGASHPEELVARAKELDLAGLALVDRDGLYGSARAFAAGRDLGQRVIVGAELSVGMGPRPKQLAPAGENPAESPTIALLVERHEGYVNLCRLLTLAHAELPKGQSRLELGWLCDHSEGLLAVVPAPRRPGDASEAPAELLEAVRGAFGSHAALAIHRHLDGFDAARRELVRGWSARYGLPQVASARPLYHDPARKPLSDVLHCIREKTVLDRAGTALSANAQAHLRSESEMAKLFQDEPALVERSAELAESLVFSLSELRYRFPCKLAPGESADEKLRVLTLRGISERYREGGAARRAAAGA
jgi:error-prone DNA polymerase